MRYPHFSRRPHIRREALLLAALIPAAILIHVSADSSTPAMPEPTLAVAISHSKAERLQASRPEIGGKVTVFKDHQAWAVNERRGHVCRVEMGSVRHEGTVTVSVTRYDTADCTTSGVDAEQAAASLLTKLP